MISKLEPKITELLLLARINGSVGIGELGIYINDEPNQLAYRRYLFALDGLEEILDHLGEGVLISSPRIEREHKWSRIIAISYYAHPLKEEAGLAKRAIGKCLFRIQYKPQLKSWVFQTAGTWGA